MISSRHSFTLIELLIVIGILAILTAAVVVVLNPSELLKQSRDSSRMTDLASLHKALQNLQTQVETISLGTASTVYISIPDTSATCSNLSLPTLPSGYTYRCVTATNLRNINGTGWLPISFTSSTIQNFSSLPLDPVNTTSSGLYYTYVTQGGTYELTNQFESSKYVSVAADDGGVDPAQYEIGNNLTLSPFTHGLIGYWSFDEGSGAMAYDYSGYGSHGTLINNPTWSIGKIGSSLSFNNSDTYVRTSPTTQFITTSKSIVFWANPTGVQTYNMIFSNGTANYYITFRGTGDMFVSYVNNIPNQTANIIGSGIVTINNWNHYSVTFEVLGSSVIIKTYKNGELVATQVRSDGYYAVSTVNFYFIGSFGPASGVFNGSLDDIRIYNRTLSSSEIKALYEATK